MYGFCVWITRRVFFNEWNAAGGRKAGQMFCSPGKPNFSDGSLVRRIIFSWARETQRAGFIIPLRNIRLVACKKPTMPWGWGEEENSPDFARTFLSPRQSLYPEARSNIWTRKTLLSSLTKQCVCSLLPGFRCIVLTKFDVLCISNILIPVSCRLFKFCSIDEIQKYHEMYSMKAE